MTVEYTLEDIPPGTDVSLACRVEDDLGGEGMRAMELKGVASASVRRPENRGSPRRERGVWGHPGVGLDLLAVHLCLHPGLEPFHDRLAVGLVMNQALLRVHPQLLGLGIHAVDFPQGFEHVATFVGEVVRHAHKLPPAVIDDQRVIEKILRHLGLWCGPPSSARPPPKGRHSWRYEPCDDPGPVPDYENVLTD